MTQFQFDYAAQGAAHLTMILNNALALYGLPAQIFTAEVVEDMYSSIMPGYTQNTTATGTCQILLSKPVQGIALSGSFISLPDKVTIEYTVTTTATLLADQQLLVTFPDGKTLNLRVTEADTDHEFSQIAFMYKAVVI